MTVYRAHNADHGDWHEIVGESGEPGEGCLITAVRVTGIALAGGAAIGLILLGAFLGAFKLDLW